jgi:ankyrin repeat protein
MLNSNISVNARDEVLFALYFELMVSQEGCTALMWGCHYGHEGVTQLLLKRGVDLNLTNKVCFSFHSPFSSVGSSI